MRARRKPLRGSLLPTPSARGGALALLLSTTALLACGASASAPQRRHPLRNPLAGNSLYLNPNGAAARQVALWQAQGDTTDARLLQPIALQPVATWFASDAAPPVTVSALTADASAAHAAAVIVAYNIPHRDCGGYSGGGARTNTDYLRWIGQLAAGIGPHKTIVIVEPDAVAQALGGCGVAPSAIAARLTLLHQAIAILKRQTGAVVYLDAGNAGWIKQLHTLAAALRRSGIDAADGFALNVANFKSTAASTAYGQHLSRLLGGAHFVIDTARNGNGPPPSPNGAPKWCNPPGRALGPPPTTHTGNPLIDALLWVKPPGESDGACRPGEPPAGKWWPQYALALAAATPH